MKKQYVYRGWRYLNMVNAVSCLLGDHELVVIKTVDMDDMPFEATFFKCKRCSAIICESGMI
jgi:hypothetical protein